MHESVQQDRRMETVPRRERTKGTRDGRQKVEAKGGVKAGHFSNPGATRAHPRLLVKRAYLVAECASAENEGNSYCLVNGGR